MNTLHQILAKQISENPSFKFHPKCGKIKLFQLSFADDLLLCCNGDVTSIQILKNGLNLFHRFSGLQANTSKSNIFVTGVTTEVKDAIVDTLGYTEGILPIRYLGVPLLSSKLRAEDCSYLVDNITHRVSSWKLKSLSYAGRL